MDRTVRHLRLRAPNAQAATHAAHRLEDALRCASLPDAGGRVLLVRRLHLGRLPAGLSSQSLSLLIERRVAEVGGEWVHGDDAVRAAQSDTVFFPNRLRAAQAALRRHAMGRPLDAWYWPLALPGVAVTSPPTLFLDRLLDAGLWAPAARAALPSLLAAVVQQGDAEWLLRHLSGGAVQRLLGIVAPQGIPAHEAPQGWAGELTRAEPGGDSQRLRAAAHWPRWLHAVLGADQWHRPLHAPGVCAAPPAVAAHWRLADPTVEHGMPVASAAAERSPAQRASDDPGALPVARSGFPGPAVPVAAAGPVFDGGPTSDAGGLLFVIPVLQCLGFADWQRRYPDAPLCGLILRHALMRLGVADDDGAWKLVASLPMPIDGAPRRWTVPAAWSRKPLRMAVDAAQACSCETMAMYWLTAVRRFLRRVARIGLASLCLRRARLSCSATHLDARFTLSSADLRVRRLGLDVDPGWIDWLGRVVAFEYVSSFETP